MKTSLSRFALPALLFLACGYQASLRAQQVAVVAPADTLFSTTTLPEAPAPQTQEKSTASYEKDDEEGQQTKRILGIVPNFRAVSANAKLPPETLKEKFVDATEDSFDYSSLVFPAVIAAYNQHGNNYPEFGTGGVAFGRYFWHALLDQTSENYWVEFIVPAVTHEDTRFYTLGHGTALKRTEYALTRIVITRTDSGKKTFNAGEVLGAGISAGMSNLYYPSRERTFKNTADQWVTDLGIDAGVFLFKEFWPDINRKVLHHHHTTAN